MKRFFAVVLSMIMALALFSGCGSSRGTDSKGSGGDTKATVSGNNTQAATDGEKIQGTDNKDNRTADDDGNSGSGEAVSLTFYMASSGNMEDAALVAEKVNEYIRPLIGAEVSLNYINMGSYSEQVGLMVRSGETLDVLYSVENDARNYIRQEAILPLDDLLKSHGEGIVEQIGADNLEAARVNGSIYSLPSLKDMAMSRMFVYDKAIADEMGLDFSNVKTLEDLTPVFAQVKEKYPEMSMFGGAGGSAVNFDRWDWDSLSDSMGVLMNNGQDTEVVNLFATEEYSDICHLMREWYQAGYIEKDFATSSDTWNGRMKAGTAFGAITSYKPGAMVSINDQVGKECGYVVLTEPLAYTSSIVNTNWMIPASSENPEMAMEFLRLMYTDPVVANLLINGIEGIHYEENEDGTISRIDPDNCKYQQYLGWAYGNQFITKVFAGNDLDVYEQTREFNNTAIKSKALGFSFDNSSVVNELTACTNVANKYRTSLECGDVDPDEVLPRFISELEEAVIKKIMIEKQKQLDEWMAAK